MAVFILSLYSLFKTISDIYTKSKRVSDIRSELSSLEKENKKLAEDLGYKTSREFVEKEAREKLFMGLPGEKILIIPQNFFENLNKNNKSSLLDQKDEIQKPVWKQWVEKIL